LAIKPVVLFVCTGNACRSQMAEGFLRKYAGDQFSVYSGGTQPKETIHPLAVQVMAERGIDISGQQPKGVDQFLGRLGVRHLIIVCKDAEHKCPRVFPGAVKRCLWPFDAPDAFEESDAERLSRLRRLRDEIDVKIRDWLVSIGIKPSDTA